MSIASPEIRKIAVVAYLSGKATQQRLADILGFHRTAIVRWVREYRKNGKLEPQVRGHMSRTFPPEERERLVFLDESSAKTNMTRLRGRSRGGARCHASVPCGHWKTVTMLSSIRLDGSTEFEPD
jgi:transposase